MIEQHAPGRTVEFWIAELKRTGQTDSLPYFNRVMTGRDLPPGLMRPFADDVTLDGRKVDIYHWGQEVYIRLKD